MTNNYKYAVSVCMITYNHQDYIEQAINSILSQNFNHEYELIISNDNSKDSTHDVIRRIIEEHPKGNLISYYNQETNLGITKNFVFTINKAKGKYIAICEGDDYWIDDRKLYKQFSFLESNLNYSGVASNSTVIFEDLDNESYSFSENKMKDLKIDDFMSHRNFHTATFFFRSSHFSKDFPLNILSADRTLFLLISCYGLIKFFPEFTAVYRKNSGGISSKVISKQLVKDYKIAPYIKKKNKNFNIHKFQSFVSLTILQYSHQISLGHFLLASIRLIFYTLFDIENKGDIKSKIKKCLSLIKFNRHKVRVQ